MRLKDERDTVEIQPPVQGDVLKFAGKTRLRTRAFTRDLAKSFPYNYLNLRSGKWHVPRSLKKAIKKGTFGSIGDTHDLETYRILSKAFLAFCSSKTSSLCLFASYDDDDGW